MPPQQPAIADAHHQRPATTSQPPSQTKASRAGRKANGKGASISQKELSVVVILLAAETAVVTTSTAPSPAGGAAPTTTVFTVSSEAAAAAGLSWLARQPLPKVDAAVLESAKQAFVANGADGLNAATRKAITSFLPWRDCLALRQSNKAWRAAADETVRVTTLPSNGDVRAMFLPCPRDVDADTTTEARLKCRHASKWRCPYCAFCNSETRILCGNRHCQIPCPTHLDCARLFLGQLRREGTVPFITWLVESVLGSEANPMHIVNAENHRQLSTGRGKGCSWIYLASRSMAPTVLNYHHRVFTDVDPVTKREGVWIVAPADAEALAADVSARATYDASRSLLLPRGALVVEYPSRQPYATLPPEALPAPMAHHADPAAMPPPAYHHGQGMHPAASSGSYPESPFPSYAECHGAATPIEHHWLAPAATDSPPSEVNSGSDEQPSKPTASPNMAGASTTTLPGANGSSTTVRRHQPYRSPVAAGTPAMPTASQSPLVGPECMMGAPGFPESPYSGSASALPPMMSPYHAAAAGQRPHGGSNTRRRGPHRGWGRRADMYAPDAYAAYGGNWAGYGYAGDYGYGMPPPAAGVDGAVPAAQ
eukprot:CAMPEP_0174832424 /NCGR_PEP_ID=MMETSP1114-20130205/3668_1 /TAXON_ID=312471 /ORGANISM="Neobodo designis, Strain CCAP 1951/1" /LENGTH=596 /DNA_ID=CAMNT_0016066283 /DNA_START=71 /DNA_END=1861 /DNA_ORIENTATION=+